MKRKLNYTDRKRIKKENISITFVRQNDSIVSFRLNNLNLDDLKLPPDAKVYVEAYYRTELKRFDFGTVAKRVTPPSLSLEDMAYAKNLKFRILVVNPSDGKVLAHADKILPEDAGDRKSILPVEFDDLGNEIWRVKYEGDEGSPILLINRKIPNIENIAKQDPQFFIYVYPAVIREILTHMIFVEEVTSPDSPAVDWHGNWLNFVKTFNVSIPEILDHTHENFDKDEVLEWIDNIVSEFSDTYGGKFQEYVQKQEEIQWSR